MGDEFEGLEIAVLIPCFNEEVAVPHVIADFRRALPAAKIYVYDNASTDRTAEVAARAGAIVGFEPFPGKGNVMRRMFSDIEADIYVLVDGDDTYDAQAAPQLVRDAARTSSWTWSTARACTEIKEAYRFGHRFGNRLLTGLVQRDLRQAVHRHALRLPRLLAPLRQVASRRSPAASRSRPSSRCMRSSLRMKTAEVPHPLQGAGPRAPPSS